MLTCKYSDVNEPRIGSINANAKTYLHRYAKPRSGYINASQNPVWCPFTAERFHNSLNPLRGSFHIDNGNHY
jgi:hypothetical protein